MQLPGFRGLRARLLEAAGVASAITAVASGARNSHADKEPEQDRGRGADQLGLKLQGKVSLEPGCGQQPRYALAGHPQIFSHADPFHPAPALPSARTPTATSPNAAASPWTVSAAVGSSQRRMRSKTKIAIGVISPINAPRASAPRRE